MDDNARPRQAARPTPCTSVGPSSLYERLSASSTATRLAAAAGRGNARPATAARLTSAHRNANLTVVSPSPSVPVNRPKSAFVPQRERSLPRLTADLAAECDKWGSQFQQAISSVEALLNAAGHEMGATAKSATTTVADAADGPTAAPVAPSMRQTLANAAVPTASDAPNSASAAPTSAAPTSATPTSASAAPTSGAPTSASAAPAASGALPTVALSMRPASRPGTAANSRRQGEMLSLLRLVSERLGQASMQVQHTRGQAAALAQLHEKLVTAERTQGELRQQASDARAAEARARLEVSLLRAALAADDEAREGEQSVSELVRSLRREAHEGRQEVERLRVVCEREMCARFEAVKELEALRRSSVAASGPGARQAGERRQPYPRPRRSHAQASAAVGPAEGAAGPACSWSAVS